MTEARNDAHTERRADIRQQLAQVPGIVSTRGLDAGIQHIRDARPAADADFGAVYLVDVELGRWTAKQQLGDGLEILCAAQNLLVDHTELLHDPDLEDDRIFGTLMYGILLADDGQLSSALRVVDPTVEELRNTESPHRHKAWNYLSQILLQLGQYERAERILDEADTLRHDKDSAWHSYTRLLHLLHGAQHRTDDAGTTLLLAVDARQDIEDSGRVNLIPIGRNLHVEILLTLAGNTDQADDFLRQAAETARLTRDWCQRIEETRSEILAGMLHARALLQQGHRKDAEQAALRAVGALDRAGGRLPGLPGENIYYHAARILTAGGLATQARDLDRKAQAEVIRKLHYLEPDHQEAFQATLLNQAILTPNL